MCGIAGIWDRQAHRFESALYAMTQALEHRGPDGAGYWVDGRHGVALGHRRLSILDLSEAGRQPMFSVDGRYALSYNGEVYNYEALRREVRDVTRGGYPFRGGSDTEVLLGAISTFGLRGALEKTVGMFAFALWDRQEGRLHLVRDRLGIKPLYYGYYAGGLVFGSELSALLAHPQVRPSVDREALGAFLQRSTVPAPRTIYEGIYKLCPGEHLCFTSPRAAGLVRSCWWRTEEVLRRALEDPFRGNEEEATDELEALLREAVGCRLVSDVPLGALLSGGIDSTMVVALMQRLAQRPVKTYSIGFAEEAYDEGESAAAVAAALGTDHTGLVLTAAEVMPLIARLPELYDEPFADSSQLPTFVVSRLARGEVKVALSGDGGDEVFGGYNRHLWAGRMARLLATPRGLRRGVSRALLALTPDRWDDLFARLEPVLPSALRLRLAGDKAHKLGRCMGARDLADLYDLLTSEWSDPEELVANVRRSPPGGAEVQGLPFRHPAEEWMARDLCSYLPDDILTKVDRASMAVSLEARVPLLDHRVVEWAFRLPISMRVRGSQGKWILRRVLSRYVPLELVDRPKMGFGVPLDRWLRGPLRPWAEGLLAPDRLRREGFFEADKVRGAWQRHLSGRENLAYPLWNLLVFQSWWEARRPGARAEQERATP